MQRIKGTNLRLKSAKTLKNKPNATTAKVSFNTRKELNETSKPQAATIKDEDGTVLKQIWLNKVEPEVTSEHWPWKEPWARTSSIWGGNGLKEVKAGKSPEQILSEPLKRAGDRAVTLLCKIRKTEERWPAECVNLQEGDQHAIKILIILQERISFMDREIREQQCFEMDAGQTIQAKDRLKQTNEDESMHVNSQRIHLSKVPHPTNKSFIKESTYQFLKHFHQPQAWS